MLVVLKQWRDCMSVYGPDDSEYVYEVDESESGQGPDSDEMIEEEGE